MAQQQVSPELGANPNAARRGRGRGRLHAAERRAAWRRRRVLMVVGVQPARAARGACDAESGGSGRCGALRARRGARWTSAPLAGRSAAALLGHGVLGRAERAGQRWMPAQARVRARVLTGGARWRACGMPRRCARAGGVQRCIGQAIHSDASVKRYMVKRYIGGGGMNPLRWFEYSIRHLADSLRWPEHRSEQLPILSG